MKIPRQARRAEVTSALIVGLVLVLGFAAGGATVYFLFQPPAAPVNAGRDTGVRVKQAGEGGERQGVVALGRLEPEGGVVNIGVALGDRLDRVVVKEGDEVKQDQELAFLATHTDRLADRNLAGSQLKEAEDRLGAVTASCQAVIKEAEIRVVQVQKVEPLEIQAQEARVRLLEKQAETTQGELDRLLGLKLKSVPESQIELQKLAAKKAVEELAAAQSILKKAKEAHSSNLEAAQAALETAKANLNRYQIEIPLDSLKKTLELAEARLKHTIIRAPTRGRILKIIAHPGETLGTRPILQMSDTQHMLAIAEVYETDVAHVKKGNKAAITSPALAEPLAGTVVHIGSMVAKNTLLDVDPTAASDHRVVEVKVRLDSSTTADKYINLQVKVTITTE